MNIKQIPLTNFFICENSHIQSLIRKFDSDVNFDSRLQCIREFSNLLALETATEDGDVIVGILTFLYITVAPSNPLKKTIARSLAPVANGTLLEEQFCKAVYKVLDYINALQNQNINFLELAALKDYIICSLMSNLDTPSITKIASPVVKSVFDFTFTFLHKMVNCLWNRNPSNQHVKLENQIAIIHNSSKCILTLLQKYKTNIIHQEDILEVIKCCFNITKHRDISYETKSNCAYIIIILCAYLPEDFTNECIFKNYPYLEFLKLGKERSSFLEKLGITCIGDKSLFETFIVAMFVSILLTTPKDFLCQNKIYDKVVALYLLEELLEATKGANKNSSLSIGIAKGISCMSHYFHIIPDNEIDKFLREIFRYIIIYVDDKAEIVRNHVKMVYRNIIKWMVQLAEKGDAGYLELVTEWILQLSGCTIHYVGISLLCEIKGCDYILKRFPNLANKLLSEMDNLSKVYTIYPCYEFLMKQSLKETACIDEWINYWVKEIIEALKKSEPPLTFHYQKLFKSAFVIQPLALKALTQQKYINTPGELGAFLNCIRYARHNQVAIPIRTLYNKQIDGDTLWKNLVEHKTLGILCTTQMDNVRLLVLEILVESKKTTELFTKWELETLIEYIYYNINILDASVRQQTITCIKKAMTRIQESEAALRKYENNVNIVEASCNLHTAFWVALFHICSNGLNSGCNYGRRSSCLEILKYGIDTLKLNGLEIYVNIKDLDNLKHIIEQDTFEHNKKIALDLLNHFSPEKLGFSSVEVVQNHIKHCFGLALSVKPVRTISAAYMLKICLRSEFARAACVEMIGNTDKVDYPSIYDCSALSMLIYNIILKLIDCLSKGKSNIQEAAAESPVHGLLFCLRHLLEMRKYEKQTDITLKAWRSLYKDILHSCFDLGKVVETIICNPSPEGFLPDDMDYNNAKTDETSKAQMVTVYGWRAAKEISLLLGEISLEAPYYSDEHSNGILTDEQFQQIGDFFFNLLINTKHRGAFEQASIGFFNLCYRLHRIPNETLRGFPEKWLINIIDNLFGNGNVSLNACATRRSAGIPFMIQAILASEPGIGNCKLLHNCLDQLLLTTPEMKQTDEQQIHCMNILRAIFRHNQLSSKVSNYTGRAMIISITGFANQVWGIRNSATLLFSALMNNIFGVLRTRDSEELSIKNKMMVEVFFTQYPELYDFLLKELKEAANLDKQHSSLFPVLLVLNRLYYSGQSSKCIYDLNEYTSNIWLCLANPSYRIRNLAAKTFVNLLHPNGIPTQIVHSFVVLSNIMNCNNFIHGILLQLQYLLKQHQEICPPLNLERIIDGTGWIIICCDLQISYFNAALYLEIIMSLILQFDSDFKDCKIFTNVLAILQWYEGIPTYAMLFVSPAAETFKMTIFNLKLYLIFHNINCVYCRESQCSNISILKDLPVHNELQSMCISYLSYLYFTTTAAYAHHNLYKDDDHWEHTGLINKFLKPLKHKYKILLEHILCKSLEKVFSQPKKHALQIHAEVYLLQYFLRTGTKTDRACTLTTLCHSNHEQTATLAIAALDVFLKNLTNEEMKLIQFNDVVDVVLKCCSPLYDPLYRLGVCKLLVNNKQIFWNNKNPVISKGNLCILWHIVFILLEDDDEDVRNTICQLCQNDLVEEDYNYLFIPQIRLDIPQYSRKKCLDAVVESLEEQCCINVLLSWMLRGRITTDTNPSVVFDEGDSNTYAETYPFAIEIGIKLNKILWDLDVNDSITIQDQTILIIANLYCKFHEKQVPLISEKMSCVLLSLLEMLLDYFQLRPDMQQPHFKREFKAICDDWLSENDSVKLLGKSELIRLKMFLEIIFKRFLWEEKPSVNFKTYPNLQSII